MWEELKEIENKIDKLRDKVRRAVEPVPASARELTTLVAQEITCVEDDTSTKSATFYNGSPDTFVLSRMSVTVAATTPTMSANDRRQLRLYAFGYFRSTVFFFPGPASPDIGFFDFEWNYLVSSRQSFYSRQSIGSPIFNGLERSQAFDLYEPLILKPADSLEFRMRPLCYALPGTPSKLAGTTYFVNFLVFGYRRPL